MAITSNTDKINKAYKFFYRDGLKNSFLYFPLKKIQGLDVPSMGSYFPTREGLCTYAYNSKNKVPTFLQCSVHTSRQGKEDNLYINNVKYYGDFSMARFILPFSGRKYKLRQKKFIKCSAKDSEFVQFTQVTRKSPSFWNLSFDKGRVKTLVSWFLKNYGQKKTIQLVENLKNIGFEYATKAGISLGIDDLKISPNKAILIAEAEKQTYEVVTQYKRAQITGVERFQRLIDTWHRTSETLKQEVINYFEVTDLLNPVYMMAFSGARGNISQVRQLVGMRGLMADPKGQILDFPIRSNFREGLTLTEYLISSYGARKGIVDTALRTANAGYLTRRLVDVAQHVIVSHYDCGTNKGILISDMKEGTKVIYSLQNRLIGRVLAQDIYCSTGLIATRNQEISSELAGKISKVTSKVLIRSALTCETRKLICQLCYGWSLGQGKLVSIGDAVGVIAAQSIGEPGTQLTMRTFHTGGVFSSDVNDQIIGPYDGRIEYSSYIPGTLVRTPQGKIAFLTKADGAFIIKSLINNIRVEDKPKPKFFKIPSYTLLFCRHNEKVYFKQVVAQICSASTQNKQRDDAEQSIETELQGQVYMDHLTLIEQTNDYGDTNQQSWDWGYIWILSGKIYEIPVDSYIFPKFGDFVNQNSILNQIQWIVPYNTELNLTVKKYLSENINRKLPNKRNKKLLHNVNFKKTSFTAPNRNTVPRVFSAHEGKTKPNFNGLSRKSLDTTLSKQSLGSENLNSSKTLSTTLFSLVDETSKPSLVGKHEPIKIIKKKFHNILYKHAYLSRQGNDKLNQSSNNFNFLSENLTNAVSLTKKEFFVSTNFNFNRSLLLFDTNRFSYQKLGYFFKVNLPLSIHQLHLKQVYYNKHFINEKDNFFIPVNLNSHNKLFKIHFFNNLDSSLSSSVKNLDNSFDWKNFPYTLLTWFPFFYKKEGSSLISYELNQSNSSYNNMLEESQMFLLKQQNPIFYSQILQTILKLPLSNLNYNQMAYSNLKTNAFINIYSNNSLDKLNLHFKKRLNFKNFWLFSSKQEKEILKRTLFFDKYQPLDDINVDQIKHLNFKKYSELKWKNTNKFSNKQFFYRGRIFWIPQQISTSLIIDTSINSRDVIKQKKSNLNCFSWQSKNSLLYYNITRQGKKVPVFNKLDGVIQIYKKSIFSTYKSNGIPNFSSNTPSTLMIPNKNKSFKSIKQYNQKYYIALKFKVKKLNLNTQNFKKLVIPMNLKNYKKLVFLKSEYLKTNSLIKKFKLIENKFSMWDNLPRINSFNLTNTKNSEILSSIFKFSFFNLNHSLNNQLIFDKLKSRLSKLVLQIQAGWIYLPTHLTGNLIKYNKSIIPLGKVLVDDLIFDSQLVYLECIFIKPKFLKYNLNFLNALSFLNFSDFLLSKKNNIYRLIKEKHKSRISNLSVLVHQKFFNLASFDMLCDSSTFSITNLKWVSNSKLRNFSDRANLLYLKKKDLNTAGLTSYLYENINSFDFSFSFGSNKTGNLKSNFIVIFKKVHEYNIQELTYYKNMLSNSQINHFNTNFSFLLKQHYYTSSFNKQSTNLRLISKFPNIDLKIEPKLKVSSIVGDTKQTSFLLSKKSSFKSSAREFTKTDFKTESLVNLSPSSFSTKLIFYNNSSSLLYFKLHFINNSTFQMYYKKPMFSFNYINSTNFSTFFSSYFNFMYTRVLHNLISFVPYNQKNSSVLTEQSKKPLLLFGTPLDSIVSSHGTVTRNELGGGQYDFTDFSKMILSFSFNLSKLFSTPLFNFAISQNSSYFFNDRFFAKTRLNQLFSGSKIDNVGLSMSAKKSFNYSLTSFPTVKNSYIFKTSSKILDTQSFAYSSFLSPYEGEFLVKDKTNWNTTFQKNRLLILTKSDLTSFDLKNVSVDSKNGNYNYKKTSIHNNIFIKFSKNVYKIDNLLVTEPPPKNVFLVGKFVYYGDQINQHIAISQPGQVVHLSRKKLTIRKGQSIFLSSKAILHAYNGDLIDKHFPVVTLPYQKLKAGDIVQGIPKIEQFFEARITRRGRLFRDSIPNLLKGLFKRYKLKYPLVKAVRQSFYKIQQILVDGVQRVYRSQGVTIADKHIEIIVKQMTCKVKIINGGQTGFFPGELVDLEFVEQINKILMNKVYYEPVVLGITKASLEVESFLSAASFQQTTRMLSKAAISRKKDFLKGLKENVIVGNLIPSGTGYLVYLQDVNKKLKI
uniref:DNA-directed RNA polymerase subunit beta'' n=1 Tax=Ankyra judayi TaxID=52688 RepID=A0A140HAW3_9CHLO|nr:RNA polymerase beta subunit [Ankyra judayi]AMO01312.1 RNA polymerase beta subunit [Ankyra judayi]